jgi:hypothetical protein
VLAENVTEAGACGVCGATLGMEAVGCVTAASPAKRDLPPA